MAINTWFTVTLDAAASKKPDRQDHQNSCASASADGGNVTVAYDSAVITTITALRSCVETAIRNATSRLPP